MISGMFMIALAVLVVAVVIALSVSQVRDELKRIADTLEKKP